MWLRRLGRCIIKPLPTTPELLKVAQRVMWFQEPQEALADPIRFLAYVMTYGTVEDITSVRQVVGPDEFREALAHAPPGIFDPRSWAYWNLLMAITPCPPMPSRIVGVAW